jgi:pimeloyl-ACP methyl ester carboxylesterase
MNNTSKNVIMLHGWWHRDVVEIPEFLPDNPGNWMGWAKLELEKRGYNVMNPFIRFGHQIEYEDWKKEIEKLAIDEHAILVGWSAGGAFWVRWLGETKRRVKKLILVAPAKVVGIPAELLKQDNQRVLGGLTETELASNWERFMYFATDPTLKDRVKDIVIFVSNDDLWLVESAHQYAKELSATSREIPGQEHFTNAERVSAEFLELIEEVQVIR